MIEQISEGEFRRRCQMATWDDGAARGLTVAEMSADLALVDWLESMVAVPEPQPREAVLHDWDRSGLAGPTA